MSMLQYYREGEGVSGWVKYTTNVGRSMPASPALPYNIKETPDLQHAAPKGEAPTVRTVRPWITKKKKNNIMLRGRNMKSVYVIIKMYIPSRKLQQRCL